ncbi:MAG: hypothetical protein ACQESF_04995 [Nanobdellota archaeon]
MAMRKALIFIIIFSVLLAGCGEEPECQYNSDCTSKKCFTVKCAEGKCQSTPKPDCCGNNIQDEGENACTCPEDVPEKCEGDVIVRTTDRGNEIKAEYLGYMCKSGKCVTGIDKSEQREIPLTFNENFGRFKIGFDVRFNEPFVIDEDKIKITGKLRSFSDSFKPPLRLNEVQIIAGETLFGSKQLTRTLSSEGEEFTIMVPIDYTPEKIELEKRLTLKLFYEYSYIINEDTGESKTPPEEEFRKVFDKKLYLVNTGEEK